jgi:triosephosphate isomerase
MENIFVNLKRFDVPKQLGGLCPTENPSEWIRSVIDKSVNLGLGSTSKFRLVYLLPEGLVSDAIQKLHVYDPDEVKMLFIGCQGVHWEDVTRGGNFGAFTSSLPAKAAKNLGCTWTIIGHSEERKAKLQILETYEPLIKDNDELRLRALRAISQIIKSELVCAIRADLNVLLCIGETSLERGEGDLTDQMTRTKQVLKSQLLDSLADLKDVHSTREIVIGYEPVWAIGPGKTPPGSEYIHFVSSYIKEVLHSEIGIEAPIVYGGGLKEENAKMISEVDTIDGGLVALTRFTGDIGFDVDGLKGIIDKYISLRAPLS